MTEEERDARFISGDEEALTALIACYGQALTRYCHHILCDYHEAQDAVQTVFVKACRGRASFRPGSSMGIWLYCLAYTTCIDLVRRRRRQIFAPPPEPAAQERADLSHERVSISGHPSALRCLSVYLRLL